MVTPQQSKFNREPEPDAGHVPMTEEFDNAKHNFPDAAPVIIAMIFVALVVGIIAYVFRAKPVATGTIDQAFAVDVVNQNSVLATVQLSLRNVSEKPITIRSISIATNTDQGENTDEMGSVADFSRYFAAFPALKEHSIQGIARETKITSGSQISGSVIVSLPYTKTIFDKRKSLAATISFYDHQPVTIQERRSGTTAQ